MLLFCRNKNTSEIVIVCMNWITKMSAITGGSRQRKPLVGSFEENVLNNRLEPIRQVEGYRAELKARGRKSQWAGRSPLNSLMSVSFFSDGTHNFPYLGQVHIGHKGYRIPRRGQLQVTLFNPLDKVEKLFLLSYDLKDMPPQSQTFLRHKIIFVPIDNQSDSNLNQGKGNNTNQEFSTKKRIIRHLVQLNIVSSASRIYLNKELKIYISKNIGLEDSYQLMGCHYELRSINEMPRPKYFSR